MEPGPWGAEVVTLGPGREFDAIRRFVGTTAGFPSAVLVGPGDDAAVLEGGWVASVDVSVEDVHFRRAWIGDEEIGYRATAAALSDLSAMGAEAVGVLVSVVASPERVDLDALQAGAREAAGAAGAGVVGGDLARSHGPLVVDVVVIGRAHRPVLRKGARPGDEVWVTGRLGAAAAAVHLWEGGRTPSARLRNAFARPPLRLRVTRLLAAEGRVRAAIDLSDGLAGDAGHVAAAGGVRVVLDPGAVPLAPEAVEALGEERARELALRGGEDYEMCLVAPPGALNAPGLAGRCGVDLSRVGRVDVGEGVWLEREGAEPAPIGGGGFDHLRGVEP